MTADSDSLLVAWATGQRRVRPRHQARIDAGLRFAFYGRMSTVDFQDRATSQRWQLASASELVAGHGRIVAEYFDHGMSRSLAWADRPQAARLLAAIPEPDRGFEAIVVGEYERAFAGRQLDQLAPILRRHQVALWLPETDGPVNFEDPRQVALLDLLGVRSQREVTRARYRTTAAMRAQAELQGRHLGGRPPYGYRLVDAGPHPNKAHAAWGRRLHRLEPDPATATHVQWIFAQRLAGHSVAAIARSLNDNGVPCPSGVDRDRNRHRTGQAWMLTTVAAILANPRYTGHQVWNRQPNSQQTLDLPGEPPRHHNAQRRNPAPGWVISQHLAHPPLVSEADFVAAQAVHTAPVPADGTPRRYALAGLVYCGICDRVMDSHWAYHRPGYRCRHGHTSTRSPSQARRKILYMREDQLLARIRCTVALHHQHPQLRNADPERVAGYLAANNMIIVGGYQTWTIETDDTTTDLASIPSYLPVTAAIPSPYSRTVA